MHPSQGLAYAHYRRVPGTVLSVSRVSYPHNIPAKLKSYSHFQDEQIETLKGHVTCPRSPLQKLGSKGRIRTQVCLAERRTTSSLPTSQGPVLPQGCKVLWKGKWSSRNGAGLGQDRSAAEAASLLSSYPHLALSLMIIWISVKKETTVTDSK